MATAINTDSGDVGFQIAPMVDVVFVLLLFFMACAGFKAHEGVLSIDVPSQSAGSTPTVLYVDVDDAGMVSVNEQVFATGSMRDLHRLTEWLAALRKDFGEDPVVIRPTADARHERVIAVLNACTEAGVRKVSFY